MYLEGVVVDDPAGREHFRKGLIHEKENLDIGGMFRFDVVHGMRIIKKSYIKYYSFNIPNSAKNEHEIEF